MIFTRTEMAEVAYLIACIPITWLVWRHEAPRCAYILEARTCRLKLRAYCSCGEPDCPLRHYEACARGHVTYTPPERVDDDPSTWITWADLKRELGYDDELDK